MRARYVGKFNRTQFQWEHPGSHHLIVEVDGNRYLTSRTLDEDVRAVRASGSWGLSVPPDFFDNCPAKTPAIRDLAGEDHVLFTLLLTPESDYDNEDLEVLMAEAAEQFRPCDDVFVTCKRAGDHYRITVTDYIQEV